MKASYSIVGMEHRGAGTLVASLPFGEPLVLIREPTNAYDRNAVQVWAQATHVGFVRATEARGLARAMDEAGYSRIPGKLAMAAGWPTAEVEE